jgi:small subunit ribosomal protein S1
MRTTGETPEERWSGMVGEDISVKVIEVDRGRKRLILSERAASKEQRAQKRVDLMNTLAVGQVHTGRVISLTDFGAFIDLGGADGLIHLSELSWEHIKHPKDVLSVGEEVQVAIINIDLEKQRIGLSRKKVLADPWIELASEFKAGQLVQGTITKLTKFGAFARLVERPEIEGLIHISELSDRRVSQAKEVVEEGQVVTVRVLSVETDRRRLGLSLKRAASEEFVDSDWHAVMDSVNADETVTESKPRAKAKPEPEANEEVETPAEEPAKAEEPVKAEASAEAETEPEAGNSEVEAPTGAPAEADEAKK